MKRTLIFISSLLILINTGCSRRKQEIYSSKDLNQVYMTEMKKDLLCIMMAYPDYVSGIEEKDNNVYIIMKSGERILYDDKKQKSFEQKIQDADIQDMMEQIYPLYDIKGLMDINYDPGRARVYKLLKYVYGNSLAQIQKNIVNINSYLGNIQFNKNNRAQESLKDALNELMPLYKNRQDIKKVLSPVSGTFNYRNIAGTNLLSPHSFGIAIDLAKNNDDYWRWTSREKGEKRLAAYPREIVAVFEKHNFIWGGKWGHFDILHFEYRPEIIYKAKYFSKNQISSLWYEGAPYENPKVKYYIELIDKALE